MRFQVLDILPHLTNPVTGREIRPATPGAAYGRTVADAAAEVEKRTSSRQLRWVEWG